MNKKTAKQNTISKISVVVPCFNEEEIISRTHASLETLMNTYMAKGLVADYELLYVDDGSADKTFELLSSFAAKSGRIKVLSFSTNFGHQAALTAGLTYAMGEVVVSLDADLQDPPEVIERMAMEYLNNGADIVYGVRSSRENDTFFKRLTAEWFYRVMQWLGARIVFNHADFRMVSREALEAFKSYGEVNRFLRGIFPAMGFKQAVVEYVREKRLAGATKYPLRKMVVFGIEGITSFSSIPLRLAFILGLINSLVALGLVLWTLVTKLTGHAIPGWTSTVLPTYLFGGIQLLFIGVLSEYVGKIYLEVKRRPLFILKDRINF